MSMSLSVQHRVLAVLLAGAFVFAAACAPATPQASPTGAAGQPSGKAASLKTLNLGVLKIAGLADVHAAQQLGYFREQGIEVNLTTAGNGNDLMTALQSGKLDITLAIPGVAMQAREKGYNVSMVVQNEVVSNTGPDTGALIVKADSPINSLKDLAGKKVAVVGIGNQGTVATMYTLKKNGVDTTAVQLVEIPPPQMNPVLLQGQVDAISQVEPFTSQILTSGEGRSLSWVLVEALPAMPLGAFWAPDDWLARNSDTAKGFATAIQKAIDYMNANPEEAKKIVADYTGLKPDVVSSMTPIRWNATVNRDNWKKLGDMMVEMGALQKPPDLDQLIPTR
jgi:NitT/TauT family transport system substrate-binding protein